MSAWGKFLAQIVVPTGGWTFGFGLGGAQTVSVVAGTYDNILDVADYLETQLQAKDATFDVNVSATGNITIDCGNAWTWTPATTTDDLEDVLGLDGTEAVDGSNVLTCNLSHLYGWYPGVISWGPTQGEGVAADDRWTPTDELTRQYAGTGAARVLAPARRQYRRTLRFGLLRAEEVFDHDRGPIALNEQWATRIITWYPDRDDGTTDTHGDQMDPGAPYYNNDGDEEFYEVTLAEAPRFEANASHPDFWSVVLVFSVEPK